MWKRRADREPRTVTDVEDGDRVRLNHKEDAVVPHDEMSHVRAKCFCFRRFGRPLREGSE